MVNATTAPTLVAKLGITAMPQARVTLVKMFHSQLELWSTASGHPEEVTAALKEMLHEAYEHIAHTQISKTGPQSSRSNVEKLTKDRAAGAVYQDNSVLVAKLKETKEMYERVPDDELHRGLLG